MTTTKNMANDPDVDPIEDALAVDAPVEELKAKKKGIPKAAKIGFGVMGAGVVALMAIQMMTAEPQKTTTTTPGNIGVNIKEAQGFKSGAATADPTNPEAIALSNKVGSSKTEAVLKDPTKSYVSADPFGATNQGTAIDNNLPSVGGEKKADDTKVDLPPPPPPSLQPMTVPPTPVMTQQPSDKEDPVLTFTRQVYNAAIYVPVPGVSPGNTKMPEYQQTGLSNSGGNSAGIGPAGATPTQDADIPAGIIAYATLTSSLNSLVPQTPPRAVIHGGRFNGAILLGQMENAEDRYLVLKFTTLTLGKKTYPVSAIAVNPEMQDAGIVDSVKDRTWTRAALQAGVGFIQAFGAAKLQEGTETNTTQGAGGTTTSSKTPTRTNEQTAIIALGGAAQAVSPTVDKEINKLRNEVIIQPGKEMGVLFMQPVYLR